MKTRRDREHEERSLHIRRLLVSIACGVAIGGTIGTLRALAIL
jgi:hypothetical protein